MPFVEPAPFADGGPTVCRRAVAFVLSLGLLVGAPSLVYVVGGWLAAQSVEIGGGGSDFSSVIAAFAAVALAVPACVAVWWLRGSVRRGDASDADIWIALLVGVSLGAALLGAFHAFWMGFGTA